MIISAVCGKGPTQLIRLAAIIQVLHDAFEFVKTRYPGLQSMTKEIEQVMIKERKTCSISKENLERAYFLLEFFNKNKLILSGFQYNGWISTSLKQIFINLIKFDNKKGTSIDIVLEHVLFSEKNFFKKNEINQALKYRGINVKDIEIAFEKLKKLNLGKVSASQNSRGKASGNFEKYVFEQIGPNIVSSMDELGIDLAKFTDTNEILFSETADLDSGNENKSKISK